LSDFHNIWHTTCYTEKVIKAIRRCYSFPLHTN